MGPITEFSIRHYSDISKEIRDIEKKIPIPLLDKSRLTMCLTRAKLFAGIASR